MSNAIVVALREYFTPCLLILMHIHFAAIHSDLICLNGGQRKDCDSMHFDSIAVEALLSSSSFLLPALCHAPALSGCKHSLMTSIRLLPPSGHNYYTNKLLGTKYIVIVIMIYIVIVTHCQGHNYYTNKLNHGSCIWTLQQQRTTHYLLLSGAS